MNDQFVPTPWTKHVHFLLTLRQTQCELSCYIQCSKLQSFVMVLEENSLLLQKASSPLGNTGQCLNEWEPTQTKNVSCVARWQRWPHVTPVPWYPPLPHQHPGFEAKAVQHRCQPPWHLLLQEQLVRAWISAVLHTGFRRNTAAHLQGAHLL